MNRKFIHLVSLMINESGIVVIKESVNKRWRFIFILMGLITATLSMIIYAITNYENFDEMAIATTYSIVGCAVTGDVLIILFYEESIKGVLYEMDRNIYTYANEDPIDVNYKWYLEEKNIILFIHALFYFQLFSYFMICCPCFAEIIFQHRVSLSMYPCWMPWSLETQKSKLFTFGLQLIQGCCAMWANCVITVPTFVVVFEFLRQFERLRVTVSSLRRRTVSMSCTDGEKKTTSAELRFDANMRENIIRCVHHHQRLYRNFKLFRIWFSKLFSLELAACMVCLVGEFLCISNVSSMSMKMNVAGVACIICGNLLTKCLIGGIFYELNDDIVKAIFYDVDWREISIENRRLLVMFHQILNRPFSLFGFSVIQANRENFARILRATYSSFNVINAAVK